MINNTQPSYFTQRLGAFTEQSVHLSTTLALEILGLCPDPVLPPKQVPLLMRDPFPSHLFTVILLQSLYLYHQLSTMPDHTQQHTPTTDKIQNSDGVLLFDPLATLFAASLQQTTSPTLLTPLSPNDVVLPCLKVLSV